MSLRRSWPSALFVCLLAVSLSSCLARRRLIPRAAGANPSLRVSDIATLTDSVVKQYDAVHDFKATVDMVPALGSAEKNHITEYKDVTAYVRFRKNSDLRLVALLPMIKTKAFDMVSDGDNFKLYIPSSNRFLVGRNEIRELSTNKIENLRPQHFLDALMVRPIDSKTHKSFLENFTDEDNAYYILHEMLESPDGVLRLVRTIWFNRLDLRLARQMIFDEAGNILTDARYSEWRTYDDVPFPKHIEINRPRDEYAAVLDLQKMDINKGVGDDQFQLEQPEGTKLQVIGAAPGRPVAVPSKKKDPTF